MKLRRRRKHFLLRDISAGTGCVFLANSRFDLTMAEKSVEGNWIGGWQTGSTHLRGMLIHSLPLFHCLYFPAPPIDWAVNATSEYFSLSCKRLRALGTSG
ncbi:hypothetical protein Poly21_19800 [Allorhodopirellula heiligendammensis]|uniref:Uncharacterized protein n=1 Tax=Allorhodopirellula heiligendammensis TaxID=2714739 RepID=A0A5C6C6T8_9BACT|nr:hypothetical protein Poly21_19800 [Allorhodopirellula heiligendammensis]